MWPESLEKLQSSPDLSHNQKVAVFATSGLIGVLFCIMLEMCSRRLCTVSHLPTLSNDSDDTKNTEQTEQTEDDSNTECTKLTPISKQILVGDFFHNLVDGVLIASSFKSCGTTFGWTVTMGCVYHEIAQELADFMVLITTGGMSFWYAAVANFLSACSTIIGCLFVVSMDISNPVLGGLLSFGGGIYLFIALSQLRWWDNVYTTNQVVVTFIMYVLGCTGVGLALLSHEHCETHAH